MKKARQETLPYSRAAYFFMPLFFFCVKKMPISVLIFLDWLATSIYYPFIVNRRRNYQDNLRHILGKDTGRLRLFMVTFRNCINYGYYLTDLFRFDEKREKEFSNILSSASGYDNVQKVIGEGKGAILLTAHLGNWELGGIVLSQLGHPVNVVYFPDGAEAIETTRTRKRLMRGVKEIRLDPDKISPIEMMRALSRGELVAMQGDKLFHDSGMKVDFFGEPAFFPRGPVLLSMMTGAPILPSFILIDKKRKYYIIVEEPIYPERTGDREKDIETNLKKVVAVFERYIGKYYDQWYCFTKFWNH